MSNKADYKLIGKSTVCSEITEDEAKILAEAMGVRELKDGELLVSEGEADHTSLHSRLRQARRHQRRR